MSRDKDKTTAKKSYSEAVSPKKKEKDEGNPFFSLSERYTSLLPTGKKMTKKPAPQSVSPTGSVIATTEPTLTEKLEELIPDVARASKTKNPHEIVKGLAKSGVTTWEGFIQMHAETIPDILIRTNNNADTPILSASQRALNDIWQMVWNNINNNIPNARLASTYDENTLIEYSDDLMNKKMVNTS